MSGRPPSPWPPPWPTLCATMLQCLVRHKGHIQLLVRAVIHFTHATLSAVLAMQQIDRAHASLIALFQLISSITLLIQCKNAADSMFVARAIASFGGVGVLAHLAACGPVWIPVCDASPWKHRDLRAFFRVLDIIAATRLSLNGFSLLAQYAEPLKRTSQSRGHEQLLRRSYIRAVGIPIQWTRAVLKLLLPQKTRFDRSYVDIGVNLARATVLIPIDVWSLRRQWMTPPVVSTCCAAGMKDRRAEEPQLLGDKEQFHAAVMLRDQSTMESALCQPSTVSTQKSTQNAVEASPGCGGTSAAGTEGESV